jgi:hypothetical protein
MWSYNDYSVSFLISGSSGTSGTSGVNGVNGQSSNLFLYNAKTTITSGNPTPTYISWNNTTQINSTHIFISHKTKDNVDIDTFLSLIIKDQKILIQDKNNSANYQKWIVSGTPSLVTTTDNYWDIPVALETSSGTGYSNFANEHNLLLGIFSFNGTSGTSGNNGTSGSSGITPTTGSWVLDPGTNQKSFTVTPGNTYLMWVNGNIPNGIVKWNAMVTISNTNVPAIGSQYAWYYNAVGGGMLVFTSIPDQIVGSSGVIINSPSGYVANTSNVFKFEITNNTGTTQSVYYGYTKI